MDLAHSYYRIIQGIKFRYHIFSASETIFIQRIFMPLKKKTALKLCVISKMLFVIEGHHRMLWKALST